MKFNEILNKKGLKATPQRLLILNIIYKAGHIDIEHIYKEVNVIISSISIATIYKNLKILVDAGIVKEVNISSFKTMYELNIQPHIHSICKTCKRIEDINIEDELVKNFLFEILDQHIEAYELNVYTKCSKCKNHK